MNTPNPDPRPREPLTPEERALATRLAQLGPHGLPPPAVDAAIIAAARGRGGARAHPRQRRGPALLGLAATLALAVGVTWQMQPNEDVVRHDEAPRERAAAVATEAAVGDRAAPAAAAPGMEPPRLADDAARNGEDPVHRPASAEPDRTPVAAQARAKAATRALPAPAAQPYSTPPPAAPPAPPVAEQASAAVAPAQAPLETPTDAMPQRRAGSSAAAAPMDRAMVDAGAQATAGEDLAGVPVARDGELAPIDWIERIRRRRDTGDSAGARESLELLRGAYPQAALPEDLQHLAGTARDQP